MLIILNQRLVSLEDNAYQAYIMNRESISELSERVTKQDQILLQNDKALSNKIKEVTSTLNDTGENLAKVSKVLTEVKAKTDKINIQRVGAVSLITRADSGGSIKIRLEGEEDE